jgi:hypothetical protein
MDDQQVKLSVVTEAYDSCIDSSFDVSFEGNGDRATLCACCNLDTLQQKGVLLVFFAALGIFFQAAHTSRPNRSPLVLITRSTAMPNRERSMAKRAAGASWDSSRVEMQAFGGRWSPLVGRAKRSCSPGWPSIRRRRTI